MGLGPHGERWLIRIIWTWARPTPDRKGGGYVQRMSQCTRYGDMVRLDVMVASVCRILHQPLLIDLEVVQPSYSLPFLGRGSRRILTRREDQRWDI